MGSFKKSLQRRQRVARMKAAKKGLKKVMNATAGIPSNCTKCNKKFDENEDPSKWHMRMSRSEIDLHCPECTE